MLGSVKLPLFPQIITGGDYCFFRTKRVRGDYSREGDYSTEEIISNIVLLTGSRSLYHIET